jgi:hypothetical protein
MVRAIAVIGLMAALSGCTFRGIPSHGGGKRFCEEQNIVSKAVLDTVSQVDLSALRGKRVRMFVLGIGDQGGGAFEAGGWSTRGTVSGGAGLARGITAGDAAGVAAGRADGAATYTDRSAYTAFAIANPRDYQYLTGRLGLQLIRNGVALSHGGETIDAEVYFLVDVFGTDRGRFELLLYSNSFLHAQTKITYYALTADRSRVLVPPTSVGAGASYSHRRFLHMTWVTRGLLDIIPEPD